MKKEQSSNSTPKTKSALLDKYEKQNDDQHKKEVDAYERLKTKESEKLPNPFKKSLFARDFVISPVSRHFPFSKGSRNSKTTESLEKIIIFNGFGRFSGFKSV